MTLDFFFFKQKTAYEMRISDWSSDVCSSDLSGKDVQGQDRPCKGGAARSANSCGSGKYLCVRGAAFGGDRAGTGQRTDQQAAAGAFSRRDQGGAVGSHIGRRIDIRSEEHTSELQSLMRTSDDVICLKKKKD